MARSMAVSFAAAVLLSAPSWAAATPPHQNATMQGLRGKNASTPAMHHKNTTKALAGSCSADDETKMAAFGAGNAEGTFPRIVADCGKGSWSLFGGFNSARYERCITMSTRVSATCASCFSISGLYGYRNCKFQCLFSSWCGRSCLRCIASATLETKTCAGVPVPDVTAC
mmetsp:Transcript_20649/g.56388  ORF Transcript_20649/g.56388 Transcript_20649/m.56388 type:complete len:170 (-) Transcript_20649:122-631(-)